MELFKKINKEHLLTAIKEIDDTGIRKGRHSSTYDLLHNGKSYPPKLVLSIASRFANGKEINPDEFSGGEGTPAFEFLKKNDFIIKVKNEKDADPWIEILSNYKERIKSRGNTDELYKWKLIKENNPKMVFNSSDDIEKKIKSIKFQNLVFKHGIAVVYDLAHNYPEELRDCFKNLFDEEVSIDKRITDFINETLRVYRKKESKLNHHQDERTIATYLTYKYPEKYTFYKDSFYQELCKKVGEAPQKAGKKYAHYLRLINDFIKNYINKDKELLNIKTGFLTPDCFEDNNNMILAQDILYQVLDNSDSDLSNELEEKMEHKNKEYIKTSLNTILYGPPGTGKTYGTMEYAVRIIEELSESQVSAKYKTREEIRERYLKYVGNKQIAFTTFHQSFSYEDFIEGIKPVLQSESVSNDEVSTNVEFGEGDDNGLQYQIEPGIFKRISEEARNYKEFINDADNTKWIKKPTEDDLKDAKFFKMSLGNTYEQEDNDIYSYCIKNNCIALGYGDSVDFTYSKSRPEIIKAYESAGETLKSRNDYKVSAVERFKLWMKEGDFVLISYGNHKLRAIGRIKGDYYFKKTDDIHFCQFRKVEWLMVDKQIPVTEIYDGVFSQQTIYQMWGSKIKKDFILGKSIDNSDASLKKNHVLIIDEINRGNIANIFGELITLIEDDKREGAEEALSVKLPYSKKSFSIPSNLFIVGTMNTADKSIEALDTALRRRFTFIETSPAPEKLKLIGEKSIKYLLAKYNDLAWENDQWQAIENDMKNLVINKDSYEDLTSDYDKLPSKAGQIPNNWSLELVAQMCEKRGVQFIDFEKMLKTINNRIEKLLDKDHRIGHAYIINLHKSDYPFTELKNIFSNKILPLLQEYFFADHGKIGLVLGNAFVVKHNDNKAEYGFAKFKGYDEDIISELKEKCIFKFTDPQSWTTETFVSIYE